jgi:hypothetical protein
MPQPGQESVLFEQYKPPSPFKKFILFLIAVLILLILIVSLLGR